MKNLLFTLLLLPMLSGNAANLEINGNFASAEGWTISSSGAAIRNNVMILSRSANERGATGLQRVKVVPGKEYDVEFEIKTGTSHSGAQLRVEFPSKWENPAIFDLEPNSLAWTPMRFRVKATGELMQVMFWIKKGPTDTDLNIRRFCIKEAADILPPLWRTPATGYPWGWTLSDNRKSVLTNDVVPEKTMVLKSRLLRGESVRWRMEPLDIRYAPSGEAMQGTMDENGLMAIRFQVPPSTVFMRISWESNQAFELNYASCVRIDNRE